MLWDVYNGVSRRGWAGGDKANWNLDQETQRNPQLTSRSLPCDVSSKKYPLQPAIIHLMDENVSPLYDYRFAFVLLTIDNPPHH
jgi:hypothetical protein